MAYLTAAGYPNKKIWPSPRTPFNRPRMITMMDKELSPPYEESGLPLSNVNLIVCSSHSVTLKSNTYLTVPEESLIIDFDIKAVTFLFAQRYSW